ncbi:MAG: hypothetical protein AAGJ18_22565, partial [Bacteroidota bacterium]
MKKHPRIFGFLAIIIGLATITCFYPKQEKHPENYVELTQQLLARIKADYDTTQMVRKEHVAAIASLASSFVPYQMSPEKG